MKIDTGLSEMQKLIFEGKWMDIEPRFLTECAVVAGKTKAHHIAGIDLKKYAAAMKRAFAKTITKSRAIKANAIYFEYDMDNDWASYFFICSDYKPLPEGDDEWACDWADHVKGPSQAEFCETYLDTDNFCNTPEATAETLHLIARTVATLCAIAKDMQLGNMALAIGFHDQTPILRIKEHG